MKRKSETIAIIAGIIIIILWYLLFIRPLVAEINNLRAEVRDKKLFASRPLPTEKTLQVVSKNQDDLAGKLDSLISYVQLQIPPEIERLDPELFIPDVELQKLMKKARDKGVYMSIEAGDILKDTSSVSQEALTKLLAVVFRFIEASIGAKVSFIEKIDLVLEEIPENTDQIFLSRYLVNFRVKGSQEALWHLIHLLQKKGSFLGIRSARISCEQMLSDVWVAEIKVDGMIINANAGIEPERD